MAANTSLSAIIAAIASSMAQAQKSLEEQQIANFITYFKEKKNQKGFFPRRLKIKLPATGPEGNLEEPNTFCIPYLALTPHIGLKIDTAEVSFSVMLGNLEASDGIEAATSADNKDMPSNLLNMARSELSVDAAGGAFGKKNGLAVDVKISISGVEMAEGSARMVNEVIKCAQGYKEIRRVEP